MSCHHFFLGLTWDKSNITSENVIVFQNILPPDNWPSAPFKFKNAIWSVSTLDKKGKPSAFLKIAPRGKECNSLFTSSGLRN